jgi:hypothetical protein
MPINLYLSSKPDKKLMIVIDDNDNKSKTIHFGQKPYLDFILYNHLYGPTIANKKKKNYIARHAKMGEDWSKNGFPSAGFLSRWILWNKKNIDESLHDIKKKFKIDIINNI